VERDTTEVRRLLADRFDYVRELGRGGTAHVHLLVDRATGERRAVKILRDELTSSISSLRLEREIRILEALRHPNIVPVLESGASSNTPYYVMPFVEGGSLRRRLNNGQAMSLADTLRVLDDVAAAIDYAHAQNVVHRDITPGNLLFQGAHALVCDFGIARAILSAADETALTSSGIAVGTPAYMSPEQILDHEVVDGRADIYALGCVAYEMLTGEPPFTGATTQAVVYRHAMDPPPSAQLVRNDLPPSVDIAIGSALAKEPGDRPTTASEFVSLMRR